MHTTGHRSIRMVLSMTAILLTLLATSHVPAGPQRRARSQPSVPDGYRELPYEEIAPEPQLSDEQERRGYMVFHRPITQPVYPNTHPRAHEQLERLTAFATPGEFEPVTLSLYPIRPLKNFRVRVSAFSGPAGEIPADAVTVRLLTYWNIGFPRYTSRETYRRLPELLERVTVHSSPERECQRWWLTIAVPPNAQPGLYKATVSLSDELSPDELRIPVQLRVLPFTLKRDPVKHHSVYYYTRNPVQFEGKDDSFIDLATANEYQAMIDYGIDTVPTMALRTDSSGESIELRDAQELDRMLAFGMRGPVPITAGNVIARIYRDTTPEGRRERHWVISQMPPAEFYERITSMFRRFEQHRKRMGWPAFVCCPIDEVAASHKQFGARVYQAVKAAGIRTYATKNPLSADAEVYRPHVDVWCSQPYSASYQDIVAQDRYEYWCYPNHNAGEIKDRRVMCRGGRMTYGYGFWRSGYTTLIPWHWAWTPRPDPFDYLRGTRSGCGQRIGDDGQVIPAVYWECFREGRDDARYLYTLQQAVWERDRGGESRCQQHVDRAKAVLQNTWNAIEVQQKYLADHMWPDHEFNARRWQMAMAITQLLRFPPVRQGQAPSVLVAETTVSPSTAGLFSDRNWLSDDAATKAATEFRDLAQGFEHWRNGTDEGIALRTPEASQDGKKAALRWRVTIDHQRDGGEGGQYPVGWPRIARTFRENELDMSQYDYLEILVRVDSDRDEVADDSTLLGLTIGAHAKPRRFYENRFELGDRQRTWIPIRVPVQDMINKAAMGTDPWKSISRVQIYLRESDYQHGDTLTFDISRVRLMRYTSPVIASLDAPRFLLLPSPRLAVQFTLQGMTNVTPDSHRLVASIRDRNGKTVARTERHLGESEFFVLDTSGLEPSQYTWHVEITTADGTSCSTIQSPLEAMAGPLMNP